MPEKRDYYQVLEVPRDASSEDLRRAYRRLAKQYHPDVNKEPGAEERFKEINEAYAILSDDERRAAYDRFGHAGLQGMPADFGINPFDIFEQFFGFGMGGGRRSRRAPRRGADLRYDQSLTFEEFDLRRREGDRLCPPGHVPGVQRLRRRTRHDPDPLQGLQRCRRGPPGSPDVPGLDGECHHLPNVRRCRRDGRDAVPGLPRDRAAASGDQARGPHPGRRG